MLPSDNKYHGKKGNMDGMQQIGTIVGGIWLAGVFLLGLDWLWPLYLLMNVLDMFTQIPILGTLLSWILSPISWLMGFANSGAPVVQQMAALQEQRLPAGQVSQYANSYVEQYGDAALMYAAHDGYPQIVQTLLSSRELGYRDVVDAADEHGNTALIYAAASGLQQTTSILLKSGADPDTPNHKEGRTPLMEACGAGHQAIATALLAAKANINALDSYGNTALHFAAYNGHYAIVRDLLKLNPRRDIKNTHGETAASYALKSGNKGIADLLNRPPKQAAGLDGKDEHDELAELMAGKDSKKSVGKKGEDDHVSNLMKMLGGGKDDKDTKKKDEEDDHISELMKLMGGNKEKEAKKEKEKEDPMSALMKMFGGKDEEEKKETAKKKEEDDLLSKLSKMIGKKEEASAADEGRIEELKKKHEEAELKNQKRIVELMEKSAEHQKKADEAEREARLHRLNATEMSFQLQSLQSKFEAAELQAMEEKRRAEQLLQEKQEISFEVDRHKSRADAAERERDLHMDASKRHQEKLSQTNSEVTEHLSRLEKSAQEANSLRDDLRKREEKIAEMERELAKLKTEAATGKTSVDTPAAQSAPAEAALATEPDAAQQAGIGSSVESDASLSADSAKESAAATEEVRHDES
eukprot:TRINITY_DN20177_c0_g1_i1.p1 TRINITY_DN20177_c0_g1~~TRINITY_DN20177_c0_g1_i1.p1  ORF type:complete len:694 (-),score=207.22 TRINITY_DN20177_c0_g1_i1:67-1986(-)